MITFPSFALHLHRLPQMILQLGSSCQISLKSRIGKNSYDVGGILVQITINSYIHKQMSTAIHYTKFLINCNIYFGHKNGINSL